MKVLDLVLRIISVLLTLFKLVYEIRRDKKKAATDCNSDGGATK